MQRLAENRQLSAHRFPKTSTRLQVGTFGLSYKKETALLNFGSRALTTWVILELTNALVMLTVRRSRLTNGVLSPPVSTQLRCVLLLQLVDLMTT